jgi:hypothetical protein
MDGQNFMIFFCRVAQLSKFEFNRYKNMVWEYEH